MSLDCMGIAWVREQHHCFFTMQTVFATRRKHTLPPSSSLTSTPGVSDSRATTHLRCTPALATKLKNPCTISDLLNFVEEVRAGFTSTVKSNAMKGVLETEKSLKDPITQVNAWTGEPWRKCVGEAKVLDKKFQMGFPEAEEVAEMAEMAGSPDGAEREHQLSIRNELSIHLNSLLLASCRGTGIFTEDSEKSTNDFHKKELDVIASLLSLCFQGQKLVVQVQEKRRFASEGSGAGSSLNHVLFYRPLADPSERHVFLSLEDKTLKVAASYFQSFRGLLGDFNWEAATQKTADGPSHMIAQIVAQMSLEGANMCLLYSLENCVLGKLDGATLYITQAQVFSLLERFSFCYFAMHHSLQKRQRQEISSHSGHSFLRAATGLALRLPMGLIHALQRAILPFATHITVEVGQRQVFRLRQEKIRGCCPLPLRVQMIPVAGVHQQPVAFSQELSLVLKVYNGEGGGQEKWRQEVELSALARQAGVSALRIMAKLVGTVYPTLVAVIQEYAGAPVESWEDLTSAQLLKLIEDVHVLQDHGIHHHDLHPANVVVDDDGEPHIIDYDAGVVTDKSCKGCSDMRMSELWNGLRKQLESGSRSSDDLLGY